MFVLGTTRSRSPGTKRMDNGEAEAEDNLGELYCIQLPRNDLHVVLGFTFAEHKDGTLLVCTMDHVFLYKQNNGILVCRVSHGYGQRCVPLPTAFTGSIVPLYGFTLRQFSDLRITFTEIPIFTVKP
ncbi:hypothetical protein V6N13_090707 [Hibiscus sabdariffa]|uniref:Uncharacterized protein n=2 Tax=Hibiscus sabdariffa TaxID=183260 RepID=A0ABR1ZEP9_9ROSI